MKLNCKRVCFARNIYILVFLRIFMRAFSLSTGSSGNCFYIESKEGFRVLVDLGLPFGKICEILEKRGVSVHSINCVCITHEHSDHILGLRSFAGKVSCPVYLSKGTCEEVLKFGAANNLDNFRIVGKYDAFEIGDFKVLVLEMPHDSKESISFVFDDGVKKVGVFTDLGCASDEIKHTLKNLDLVFFEVNYCERYIVNSKESFADTYLHRLMSDFGHLGVHQCIDALVDCSNDNQKIVLSHISENTNSYENAYVQVKRALVEAEKSPELIVGFQGEPSEWIE